MRCGSKVGATAGTAHAAAAMGQPFEITEWQNELMFVLRFNNVY
jgi:hypothetical protein